jgi:uncharacterized OB-fold protein
MEAPNETGVRPSSAHVASGSPEKTYQAFLASGQFRIQRCVACSRHVFHPRLVCPHCGETNLRWIAPSGLGRVYSTTVVRRKIEDGGNYNVALVDLDEGVRMMSRIDGIAPLAVRIGQRVRAHVTEDSGTPIVVFRVEGPLP